MTAFKQWLATSPNATWLKVALGASIGAIASYVATSQLHPLMIAICAAVAPVLVNWLNTSDPRYGVGSGVLSDVHDVFPSDEGPDA